MHRTKRIARIDVILAWKERKHWSAYCQLDVGYSHLGVIWEEGTPPWETASTRLACK